MFHTLSQFFLCWTVPKIDKVRPFSLPMIQSVGLSIVVTRSSADTDELRYALEKLCNSRKTFKDTQGHYNCCY